SASGSRCDINSPARCPNKLPTTAAPTEPPICRKKLFAAVAVPTILMGKVICTTSVKIDTSKATPTPTTTKNSTKYAMEESGVSRPTISNATVAIPRPTTGKYLYLPVLEM